MVERICAATRAENRAAAAQLVAVGIVRYRLSRCSETEDWAIDTMEAVAAEVGAACGSVRGCGVSGAVCPGECANGCRRWVRSFAPGISISGCFRRSCFAPI